MGDIVHLPGTRTEPKSILALAMTNEPEQVIVMELKNQEWQASWSQMTMAELTYAHRILGIKIDEIINGEREPTL